MKKLLSIIVFALIVGLLLWSGDALAQSSSEAWDVAFAKTTNAFQQTRKIIFIVSGFLLFLSPGIIALTIALAIHRAKHP